CDNLRDGKSIGAQTALARLRILALWIDRTPIRRQKWNEVCKINNLSDKYIEYDVDTRWNSTFRMLDDGLSARQQISKFLELQTELPAFTTQDWLRLSQIHKVLSKFNELTLFISKRKPQISLAIPIFYELHDFLHDASEFKNDFVGFDADIGLAVQEGIKKYNKYYNLMDESDVYYTALVLDPRVKGNLILDELSQDNNSGRIILQSIRGTHWLLCGRGR
ncbi:ribonuclease H-like domain-containing protein, partial [Lipomyces starkeyi]